MKCNLIKLVINTDVMQAKGEYCFDTRWS